MKPWFRKSCDWHRSAAVDELRSLLGQQTPLALVIFDSICAWCAENNVTSCPAPSVDREVRTWTTNAALGRRLVGGLVDVGLLAQEGDGYLIDAALVQRPEPQESEEAPASRRQRPSQSRQERYRQTHADEVKAKDRARKASRKPSATVTESVTDSVTPSTTPVTESADSVTFRDTPAPPVPPPTPAQARAQARAHTHEGGAPAAAPAPLVGGGEVPPLAQEPKAKKTRAPRPPRALPPRAALAAAYAAGVSQVTGAPCSPPTERWALDDLEAMLSAHAPGLVGAEALDWLTRTARGFAGDKLEDRWTVDKGFPPKMARSWLDGGNRPPPDHGPRPPPPGPKVRPGPGPTHNWLLDEPPPESEGDSVEELTRDLFALPPDLLTPEAAQ